MVKLGSKTKKQAEAESWWEESCAWPWAAFVFLMQVVAWPALERPGEAARVFLLPLAIGLLAFVFWKTRRALVAPLLVAGLVVFVALAALGGLLVAGEAERWSVFLDGIRLLVPVFLVLGLSSVCGAWPRLAGRIDEALGWGAALALVLVSLAGLGEAWLGVQVFPVVRPPAGPYLNRNVAAQALVLLLPLALVAGVKARHSAARWLALSASCLGLAFLIVTRSRGGWAAAAAGCGVAGIVWLVAWRRDLAPVRRSWPVALLLAATAAVATLIPVGGADPLPSVGRSLELVVQGGGSADVRMALWRNTLEIVRDEPFLGVGAGRFPVVYPLYHSRAVATPDFGLERQPEHAHGDFLEYAAELGVPAALCLGLLFAGALWRSARLAISDPQGEGAWALARVAALVAVLAHGTISFPLHSPASAVLAYLLVGRAWAGARPCLRREGDAARRIGFLRSCFAASVCLALCLVSLPELRGQLALGSALAAHGAGRLDEASALAETAAGSSSHRRTDSLASVVLYASEKDAARSLALLEPALAANPHHLNLLLDTGARRLKAGRPAEAQLAFQHALEISPGLGRAWLGLAMSFDARGDRIGARDACRRAVELARIPQARLFCEGNGYR